MKTLAPAISALLLSALFGAAGADPANPVRRNVSDASPVPYQQADLDEGSRAVLNQLAAAKYGHVWELPPAQVRKAWAELFAKTGLPTEPSVHVEDARATGPSGNVPLRVYRPAASASQSAPVLVFFHGGGMVGGSLDGYDAICERLAAGSGFIVVAVDYRLAPEHRFPAGVDDAYAAVAWVSGHAAQLGIDAGRIAVGGDSAGGYLAAVVAQMARARSGPRLLCQVLIYPAVGTRGRSRSMDLYADGYFFSKDELGWIYAQYVSDAAAFDDPGVQPILAADFGGLPPALVVTAEYDILRDDAEQYGMLLRQAGVPVVISRYGHTIHAFVEMAGAIPAGQRAIKEVCAYLKKIQGRLDGKD